MPDLRRLYLGDVQATGSEPDGGSASATMKLKKRTMSDYRTQDAHRSVRTRVGFYGCSKEGGRVVSVGFTGVRPPATVEVRCPQCGERHDVAPMWRPIQPKENWEPEVVL